LRITPSKGYGLLRSRSQWKCCNARVVIHRQRLAKTSKVETQFSSFGTHVHPQFAIGGPPISTNSNLRLSSAWHSLGSLFRPFHSRILSDALTAVHSSKNADRICAQRHARLHFVCGSALVALLLAFSQIPRSVLLHSIRLVRFASLVQASLARHTNRQQPPLGVSHRFGLHMRLSEHGQGQEPAGLLSQPV